jgi:6-pyruvoyl-tetrahydropterin synthase
MAFEKKFELKLYVPATWEPSGDMPLRWRDNLKNAAKYMYDRLMAKIPDDGTFISEMATRASRAYRSLIDPAFVSKSGRTAGDIKDAHAKNLGRKFNQWVTNLTKSFATVDGVDAKSFKEKVDAAINNWANAVADKSIRLTGDKIRGRSVAPIAASFLIGEDRATSWVKQGDTVDGAPYNITTELEKNAVKVAILQKLVQGGMMVINSEFQESTIDEQNAINAALLTKLRETARCDAFVATPAADKCFCSWEMDGNLLLLHVQVGLTV